MTKFTRAPIDPVSRQKTIEGMVEAWRKREPFIMAHISEDVNEFYVRQKCAQLADDAIADNEIWINDIYQVNIRRGEGIVHLSIKRQDKAPCKDWRHFQQIKNELVGPECEGVELYPAESRLVDGANQYHIWVITEPGFKFPFGFDQGRAVSSNSYGGAVQRPLEEA